MQYLRLQYMHPLHALSWRYAYRHHWLYALPIRSHRNGLMRLTSSVLGALTTLHFLTITEPKRSEGGDEPERKRMVSVASAAGVDNA